MSTACEALGLDPLKATPADVQEAYYRLARVHHPDHGGKPDAFIELVETKKLALEELRAQVCPKCHGMKLREIVRGFNVTYLRCESCQGTGRRVLFND